MQVRSRALASCSQVQVQVHACHSWMDQSRTKGKCRLVGPGAVKTRSTPSQSPLVQAARPSAGGSPSPGCWKERVLLGIGLTSVRRDWQNESNSKGSPRNRAFVVAVVQNHRSHPNLNHRSENTSCGLTLRSSGPPPAWHLAREPASVIIRFAGQAPTRWRPLSSNVMQTQEPHAPAPEHLPARCAGWPKSSRYLASRGAPRTSLNPARCARQAPTPGSCRSAQCRRASRRRCERNQTARGTFQVRRANWRRAAVHGSGAA